MCGFCGFFGDRTGIDQAVLNQMNNSIRRRGPDEGGMLWQPEVGLAMRRLSIIDLGGGKQPIVNEDGTVAVVFNGEIYNFQELRAGLEERGHIFKTHTDTEVLVHLYEDYGVELVEHLRGMFAFALWDSRRHCGILARDRIGIKPLFYAHAGEAIIFGSEIKAIFASGAVDRDLDLQGMDAFFTYTYIPPPHTIYKAVKRLEPGHVLVFQNGVARSRRYWDLSMGSPEQGIDEQQWAERFEESIVDAVRSHLVSDVPVGAFLSGGIDSSLVVALMSQNQDQGVQTFTMGFGGGQNSLLDERPLAELVAKQYGCQFRDYLVQPDFREIAGDIVSAFDEPFADDSVIPSYYLCQLTHESVKVALSGLGGDELFGGYNRYHGVLLADYYARLVPDVLHRHLFQPLVERIPEPAQGSHRVDHAKRFASGALRSPGDRYLSFVATLTADQRHRLYSPDLARQIDLADTDAIVTDLYNGCDAPDAVARALYTDIKTYLPEDILALSDRLSMWHSLEVRVPLVDHHLVELSAKLPTRFKLDWRRKKLLLRRIAASHLPSKILTHRKQGFESPMAAWLRDSMKDYARDILSPSRLGRSGIFDMGFVLQQLNHHISGRQKNNKLLFSLIMFQEWFERQNL